MADVSDPEETMDDLHEEVVRLQNELEQAAHDKMQAAEYGLAVLEEKQHLQLQYDELETLYETTRTEFDCAKQVTKLKCTQFVYCSPPPSQTPQLFRYRTVSS